MKKICALLLFLAISVPFFGAVFNPFLSQIQNIHEGKIPFGSEARNSILRSLSFGLALPDSVLVLGRGDASALLKYGGRVQTRAGKYFTAFVPVSSLGAVRQENAIDFLNYEPKAKTYMDNAFPYVSANQTAAAGYKGDDVIVGVVDTGLDVNHQDFLSENGLSRILYLWDQNKNGKSPQGFDYGYEWTKYDIDTGACTEYDEGFHGTHVTGIAAGNGKRSSGLYQGISPRANIIFVKLNFNSMSYLLDAVSYIFYKAKSLNRPCVVNLSLGNDSGSHTEKDDFNMAMDEVVNYYGQNGHIIVWAAGNAGQSQVHVQTNATSGAFTTVNVNYAASPLYLCFWYTNAGLTVRLRDQASSTVFNYTNTAQSFSLTTGTADLESGVNGSGERYVLITIRGSSGTWKVDFTNDSTAGQIDGYIANFDPSVNNRFNNYSTNGTITGQASQKLAISVGAMITKTTFTDVNSFPHSYGTIDDFAAFSSHGPSRDGKNKPDVSAPGSFIVSVLANTPGYYLPSSDCVNEYYAALQGTSMAAPVVTGIIAQLLEKETNLTVGDIQQKFMNYTRLNGFKVSRTWDPLFGYGIADLAFLTTVNAAVARLDVTFKNNVLNTTTDKDNLLFVLFRSNSSQVGKTVRAAVYDKNGGMIRDFGSSRIDQIVVKEYVWNGKDQFDRTVRPGIYFVQVSVDNDNTRYPVLVVR
jgi:subtilisin family serine protease